MDKNNIIKKAKALNEKIITRKLDRRYRKVVGFLKAKGLLIDENTKATPSVKLDIKDVIWVGETIEPRVLKVFPAAFIHFPKTFFNVEALPDELMKVIEAIRHQIPEHQNYMGLDFKKMSQWANHPLKDRRVKPISDRKIPKNYRLSPSAVDLLRKKALAANISETEYLENLILDSL